MSTTVSSGVWQCGPSEMVSKFLLVAIADNADDFGFAFPSQETLAAKICCDVRTVQRYLADLESNGWLKIGRKMVNGKGSVYFLNLEKMGVSVSRDARKSPLHTMLERQSGGSLSRIFAPKKSRDNEVVSGDNPQPTHATTAEVTRQDAGVTRQKEGVHTTKLCPPNRTNHQSQPSEETPVFKSSTDSKIPPTPRGGASETLAEDSHEEPASADQRRRFNHFKLKINEALKSAPPSWVRKRFNELRPEWNDFDACFAEWWLWEIVDTPNAVEFITFANDVEMTTKGIEKYHARLEQTIRMFFPLAGSTVKFTVRANATAELNPAA